METKEIKWIDNPNSITIGKRLAVGGAGLAVGATIGCIVFRGHLKFYSKTIIGTSLLVGLVAIGLTYVFSPPKTPVEAKS